MELTMQTRPPAPAKSIDRATSSSICDAIGERLRLNWRPDPVELPTALRHLLDEMRRRDDPRALAQDRRN